MFKKLFGETKEEQFNYLAWRVIVTVVSIAAFFICVAFGWQEIAGAIELGVFFFVWGWGATKKILGFGTLGALFTRNVVVGILIFVLALCLSWFAGIFVAAIGILYFIYLLITKFAGSKK